MSSDAALSAVALLMALVIVLGGVRYRRMPSGRRWTLLAIWAAVIALLWVIAAHLPFIS